MESILSIFKNTAFRIPDYQREFAWEKLQLEDFWNDLNHVRKDHYTGVLTLKPIESGALEKRPASDQWLAKSKGFSLYHVVDGQQRLTTVLIVLQAIIDRLRTIHKKKDDSAIVINDAYELPDVLKNYIYVKNPLTKEKIFLFDYDSPSFSHDCLICKIFHEPSSAKLVDTSYTKRLEAAKKFFDKEMAHLDETKIGDLYEKLTRHLTFQKYIIESDYDQSAVFESLNNRGKQLSTLEILKNRLMYMTSLMNNPPAKREDVRQKIYTAWKTIYQQLGRNPDKILDDDDFLHDHSLMYFPNAMKRNLKEFLFEDQFSMSRVFKNDDKIKIAEIEDYADSLNESVSDWCDIEFSKHISSKIILWLSRLNRIGMSYFRPMILAMLIRSGTEAEQVNLLKTIEKFIFLMFKIGGKKSNFGQTQYSRTANEIYSGRISLSKAADKLQDDIKSLEQEMIGNFVSDMDREFSKGEGFFSWSYIEYFLTEYELSLSETISNANSVEHILPQNPNSKDWKNITKNFKKNEQDQLKGALGNLLMIPIGVNIKLNNGSFETKKAAYEEIASSSAEEVARKLDWTEVEIKERSERLIDFMKERWDLNISDEDKKKLVHLDFVQ